MSAKEEKESNGKVCNDRIYNMCIPLILNFTLLEEATQATKQGIKYSQYAFSSSSFFLKP